MPQLVSLMVSDLLFLHVKLVETVSETVELLFAGNMKISLLNVPLTLVAVLLFLKV